MSKMDDLRAMREARYERATSGSTRASEPATAARPTSAEPDKPATSAKPARPAKRPAGPATEAAAGPTATGAPCGHRAISGKTCTREQGHAEKSHRYS